MPTVAATPQYSKGFKWTIAALFVGSGITSLVYETLWIRVLSLGVGSTSAAIGIVLSIFFLGLSLGSFFMSRFIQRIQNPLRFYGWIEGFIGLYSLLVIFPLLHFHQLLSLLPMTGSLSWIGLVSKFLAVFLFLILPTLAMGCTLPLLVSIFSRSAMDLGKLISVLYAVNTVGAALGAFLTSFLLIPKLGVIWANVAAVLGNLIILLVALNKSKLYLQISPHTAEERVTAWMSFKNDIKVGCQTLLNDLALKKITRKWTQIGSQKKIILISTAITGYVSISFEVVWNKYLGVFFGTNIFGLGLILAIYLFGIALGSYLLSLVIERFKNLLQLYFSLLLLSIALAYGASMLLNLAPLMVNVAGYYLSDTFSLLTIKTICVTLILFLPTTLFGALFPLAVRLITTDKEDAASHVGSAYAINTIGSILGSLLTGLIWIPWIGSAYTIKMAEFLLVALLVVITTTFYKGKSRQIRWAVCGTLALLITFSGNIEFKNIIKSAYFQSSSTDLSFRDAMRFFSRDYEEFKLIVEGESGIISLSHDQQDGPSYRNYLRLKTNGLNESIYHMENLQALPKYEALLGFLPYLFVQEPQNAFIVGFGGGYTVDFLTSIDVPEVYVAELEKGIITAAQQVYGGNNPILKRKNLKLSIEDARFVLAAKVNGPYDMILSQPSHSWLTGVANLFTREFFEIVRDNLSSQGVFSQWLNLYNMDSTVLRSILQTFYSVFPHGAIFTDRGDQEMIMIGSLQPLNLQLDRVNTLTDNSLLQEQLVNVPIRSAGHVLSNFSMGRSEVVRLTQGATINTDINAFAETRQSQLFYQMRDASSQPENYLSENFSGFFTDIMPEATSTESRFFKELLQAYIETRKFDKFAVVMQNYEKLYENDPSQWEKMGDLSLRVQRYHSAKKYYEKALAHQPSSQILNSLVSSLIEMDDGPGALALLQSHARYRNPTSDCYQADALIKNHGSQQTRSKPNLQYDEHFRKIERKLADYQRICGDYLNRILGIHYFRLGEIKKARTFLEDYYVRFAEDLENLEHLIATYLALGDRSNARNFTESYESFVQSESSRLSVLVAHYEKHGLEEDALVLQKRIKLLGMSPKSPAE